MKPPCFLHLVFFFFFFLFPLLSLSNPSSSNPDFEALLAFKLSSDNSNSLSSWSNSSHPCSSWLGVICNSNNNRVTRLVLQNLNLTGSITPLTQLKHLRLLSLKHNNLSSSLDFSSWKNMKLLYLSYNHFSFNFPSGISKLRRLRRIDLSHNHFSGQIPFTHLAQLPHLLTLRLESNSFTGALLNESFKTLEDFNISHNNLSGEIPKSLISFPFSSFTGNKNLCGKPLSNRCSNKAIPSEPMPIKIPPQHKQKKFSSRTMILILITYICVVVVMGILVFFYCRKRNLRNKQVKKNGELKRRDEFDEMVLFDGCKGFGADDLLKASAEMLGKGTVGTTYKVLMDNGDVVVVKRATRERKKKKEIQGLLREIGGLRHSNVVSLRAYYCSKDELLLVYDFLPNGSLHSLLHGNQWQGRTPLDWTTRLKFSSDIAQGLTFLHNACKSKLSHGHLTSNNVVIDQERNASISDVALNQLFLTSAQSNSEYNAPELMPNTQNYRKISHGSDVYSFGVILLEILTGKMATGEGETSLVKWVQSVVREEWTSEVFDFELLRYKEMEEEMVALLQVALLCLTPTPRDRPKMNVVCKMIDEIKMGKCRKETQYSNDLSSDSSPSKSEDTPTFTST